MFQLTKEEKDAVVTNCDHLKRLKFSPNLPHAFTEHGAIMLATILNSPVAVQSSIQVVRAFVRLRQMLASNAELARKLDTLEKKYGLVWDEEKTKEKFESDAEGKLPVLVEDKKKEIITEKNKVHPVDT